MSTESMPHSIVIDTGAGAPRIIGPFPSLAMARYFEDRNVDAPVGSRAWFVPVGSLVPPVCRWCGLAIHLDGAEGNPWWRHNGNSTAICDIDTHGKIIRTASPLVPV